MPIRFIRNFVPDINQRETAELGFEEELTTRARLIDSDGAFNIKKKGKLADNLYEFLLEMSWLGFFLRLTTFYFVVNSIFAVIFLLIGIEHIKGAQAGTSLEDFSEALYFSIQTFTTVGYGEMSPVGPLANLLASFIAFSGLLTFAIATGLFFARFSRPVSHMIFSENLLITPNKAGQKSLQFRIANGNNSQLIDAEARVTLTWLEQINGVTRRRFQRLDLEIDKIYMFPLNWTLVHPIDDRSPLLDTDMATLRQQHMEVLILIRAYDETYDHYVHSKKSYNCEDIAENVRFVTMYETDGQDTILHLDRIDEVTPIVASPSTNDSPN